MVLDSANCMYLMQGFHLLALMQHVLLLLLHHETGRTSIENMSVLARIHVSQPSQRPCQRALIASQDDGRRIANQIRILSSYHAMLGESDIWHDIGSTHSPEIVTTGFGQDLHTAYR